MGLCVGMKRETMEIVRSAEKKFFGHIELFLDVVYNIALIVVVSRCCLFVVVSTLKNLRTTTQMLMKLGQCYF